MSSKAGTGWQSWLLCISVADNLVYPLHAAVYILKQWVAVTKCRWRYVFMIFMEVATSWHLFYTPDIEV